MKPQAQNTKQKLLAQTALVAWLESQLAQAKTRRNELVGEAWDAGYTYRELEELAGVSAGRISQIMGQSEP